MSLIAAPAELPRVVRIAQLAEHFGCTRGTINNWIAAGRIPEPRRCGRARYWLPSDLEALFGERSEPQEAE